jgi:hypothetical protein
MSIRRIIMKLVCLIKGHNWRDYSKVPMTYRQEELLRQGRVKQLFYEQTRQYCKRCGYKEPRILIEDHELDSF